MTYLLWGQLGPVTSRTQSRLPDRARLWLGQETGHSYCTIIRNTKLKIKGSLGFRMSEPKSTANSANSREKIKKISAICVIRGEKFTSR